MFVRLLQVLGCVLAVFLGAMAWNLWKSGSTLFALVCGAIAAALAVGAVKSFWHELRR